VEYILIGVLITIGSWVGNKVIDKIEEPKKEMVAQRPETLQCIIVEDKTKE